jgi:L-iditol 2-dehydrogenase
VKVARLHGAGDIRLGEEPPPRVAPGLSLVRVTAVGLCGSDLHWYAGGGIGDARLDGPLVIGHEFAGVVADGPRTGERVAVDPAIPCETCAMCRTGDRNLCPDIRFAGHGREDGALREFLTWPSHLLHPLPDDLSDADGAMLEPLGVAVHALDLGHVRVGATVGVFGCGPIGLLLLQVARAAGAGTVVAVDPLPHRVAAARRLGADRAYLPDEVTDPAALVGIGGVRGVDVAFEAAGTNDAVNMAIAAARPGARIVLTGIPDDDRTTFSASLARRKGLTLVMVRRMKDVYPRAVRLVQQGRVDVASVVTARYPLRRVDEAFRVAASRAGLKVVVEPTEAAPGERERSPG